MLPVDLEVGASASARSTSAVAGTITTTVIVAAPGAGLRHRLWGADFVRLASDAGRVELHVRFGVTGDFIINAGLDEGGASVSHLIPGGLRAPVNTAIVISDRASVATQRYYYALYYTTEAAG